MRIERQLCNGNWTDCAERTDEFLNIALSQNQKNREKQWVVMTRDEAFEKLSLGGQLTTGPDWYSNIRDVEAIERIMAARRAAAPPVKMVKCSCGHTIPSGSVMSGSMGSSCPDCYAQNE